MAALGPIALLLVTAVVLATDAPARLVAALSLAALVWAGVRCAFRREMPEDRAARTAARAKAFALRDGALGLHDAIAQNRIAPADLHSGKGYVVPERMRFAGLSGVRPQGN